MVRRAIAAALGLTLVAGAIGVPVASAEDPGGKSSNPIEWLKNRSAQKRLERLQAEQPENTDAVQADLQALPQDGRRFDTQVSELPAVPTIQAPAVPAASDAEFVYPVAPGKRRIDIIESSYQNTTSDPQQLKPVTEILPYQDYRPSMQIERTDIAKEYLAPEEIQLGSEDHPPRQMEAILYQWKASNNYHHPLYFEDPGLERYGHQFNPWVQPFASVGRFGVQLVGLPYQMTIDPVCKKRYTLGWYRPGDCAPKQIERIPWHTQAALNQAGVMTGLFFALP